VTDGRRPRVFLVGYYGMDNLGDEAIRDEIGRIAERIGVDVWRVATRRPRRDARAVWLTPRGARHYLAAIVGADRVVIGGGGILKDEGLRLPFDLAITCLAARVTRTPVTLAGVGVGPFYTRFGRWLIGRIAGTASYRSVRDEASAAMLASLGIDDVDVGADPVFAAERRGAPSAPRDPARPPTMLVSLRTWFLKDPDGGIARQAALLDAIAAAIASHARAGWRIEIVPLYDQRDVEPAQALADRLPPGAAVTVVDTALDWDALLDRLATVDLVVTMRFHALAAALIDDRPAVAIAYEPKVAALAARTGTPVVLVDDQAFVDSLGAALAEALEPASPTAAGHRTTAVAEMRAAAARIVERALMVDAPDG
jgi:polysaccharide pyruvyl transferase CsaB